jgi:hypothetical protein
MQGTTMRAKIMVVTGWVLTILVSLLMTFSAVMKLTQNPMVMETLVDGAKYPRESVVWIGVAELACVIVYLVPFTSVLGAVLLTGYLGGAVATHVHGNEPWIMVVAIGTVVWAGIWLRDKRVRGLLPIRPHVPRTNANT